MTNGFSVAAALLGAAAVVLGAFGQHALAGEVTPERLATWATSVQYHSMHVLVLLAASLNSRQISARWLQRSCWCFVFGIAIFSGSVYLLVLTDTPVLGAITPIGGVLLILGWISLSVGLTRVDNEPAP